VRHGDKSDKGVFFHRTGSISSDKARSIGFLTMNATITNTSATGSYSSNPNLLPVLLVFSLAHVQNSAQRSHSLAESERMCQWRSKDGGGRGGTLQAVIRRGRQLNSKQTGKNTLNTYKNSLNSA